MWRWRAGPPDREQVTPSVHAPWPALEGRILRMPTEDLDKFLAYAEPSVRCPWSHFTDGTLRLREVQSQDLDLAQLTLESAPFPTRHPGCLLLLTG